MPPWPSSLSRVNRSLSVVPTTITRSLPRDEGSSELEENTGVCVVLVRVIGVTGPSVSRSRRFGLDVEHGRVWVQGDPCLVGHSGNLDLASRCEMLLALAAERYRVCRLIVGCREL